MTLLTGFATQRVPAGEVTLNVAVGGSGPPLLLIHGYPQTHSMWHRVAPRLAERFTVIAADLRGYGDSDKPAPTADSGNYAKRVMAQDLIAAMAALGHTHFAVCGHDRGARVAYRMALDRPDCVSRLALLDIVPTRTVYETIDARVATAYFHWFFLIQPSPLPETLIGRDPGFWLDTIFGAWAASAAVFDPAALAEYRRCFNVAATCADYRAGAGLDSTHDADDLSAGRRIACPVLLLWGEHGIVGRAYDPLAVWRDYAADLRGHAVPSGHFLPEEASEETLAALQAFF